MINLNYPLLKPVRILLLPFSLIYGLIVYFRNWLFDIKFIHSASFNLPVVCVGNLSVGEPVNRRWWNFSLRTCGTSLKWPF